MKIKLTLTSLGIISLVIVFIISAAVVAVIDGVEYSTSFNGGSSYTETWTVPAGASTMGFKFVSGSWDSEVDFNIVYSKLDGSNSQTALPNVGASPATGFYALSVCQ